MENRPKASQLRAAHFSGYLLCQVVPSVPSQNKASSEYGKYSPKNEYISADDTESLTEISHPALKTKVDGVFNNDLLLEPF